MEDGLLVNVPNAFTPDGAPPNDIFKPVVIGVDRAHYRFYVFDRWGQVIYQTDDPDAGWNGQFANGTEAPIGVYVWKLMARDRFTTNRIERLGHVTLVTLWRVISGVTVPLSGSSSTMPRRRTVPP